MIGKQSIPETILQFPEEPEFPSGVIQIEGTVTDSGDNQIDALLEGYKWDTNTITYSFYKDTVFSGTYYGSQTGVSEVSEQVKSSVRGILSDISTFVDLNFVEITENSSSNPTQSYGQLRYMLSNGPSYAYAYYPFSSSNNNVGTSQDLAGDIHLSPSYDHDLNTNGFQRGPGSHGYMALIHETGHAIGLKHPGNYSGTDDPPFLPYDEDNTTNTLMTYNFTGYSASSPMLYDIKALQYIYGARQHNNGNSNYIFNTVDLYSVGGELSHNGSRSTKQTATLNL